MKKSYSNYLYALLMVLVAITMAACEDDEPGGGDDPEPELYQKTGFVVTSSTNSTPATYFVSYFENQPTGDIDLVATATSFEIFRPIAVRDGFMYGRATNITENALVKYAIDINTNELVVVDQIPLNANAGKIIFFDDNTAVFNTFEDGKKVYVFDPENMTITREIDLSQGISFPNNDQTNITSLVYNETLGKIYAPVFTNLEATPQFYDASSVYIEVIDANTLTWEKTIEHPGVEYLLMRGETNPVIDASGNTYFIAQGQYGLDMLTTQTPARPHILKVDINSEFDLDYAFNPISALNQAFGANFAQLFVSMISGGNNRAYAIGSGVADDPAITQLLQGLALGQFTLDDPQGQQLVGLVLFSPTSKVLEVDLASKTVTEVPGIPTTAGFASPFMYNINGEIFTQITQATGSGFYKIDASGNASKAFGITTGGTVLQIIDVGQ